MVFLYSSVKLSRQKRFIMDVFPTAPLPTTSTLTSFSNASSICGAEKSGRASAPAAMRRRREASRRTANARVVRRETRSGGRGGRRCTRRRTSGVGTHHRDRSARPALRRARRTLRPLRASAAPLRRRCGNVHQIERPLADGWRCRLSIATRRVDRRVGPASRTVPRARVRSRVDADAACASRGWRHPRPRSGRRLVGRTRETHSGGQLPETRPRVRRPPPRTHAAASPSPSRGRSGRSSVPSSFATRGAFPSTGAPRWPLPPFRQRRDPPRVPTRPDPRDDPPD